MLLHRQFPCRWCVPPGAVGPAAWQHASTACISRPRGMKGTICKGSRSDLPSSGPEPVERPGKGASDMSVGASVGGFEVGSASQTVNQEASTLRPANTQEARTRRQLEERAQIPDGGDETGAPATSGRELRNDVGIPYKLMAGLASAGAAETSYLTLSKLLHTEVACPTSGCVTVLSSPYAVLFGLPLPLYGMLAYSTVAALAVICDNLSSSGRHVPRVLNVGLVAGCGVLASVSASLLYLLHTALGGATCVWCYASAGLSFALLTSLLASVDTRMLVDSAGPGLSATLATVLALYAGFGPALAQSSNDFELSYNPPVVTADSSPAAVTLALRLREAGAKMYGAFWCTHCFEQKQAFGRQAMVDFPYVECYPSGWKRGVEVADACREAGVRAFPTWVIHGTVTEGEMDLDQLQAALDAAEEPQLASKALKTES